MQQQPHKILIPLDGSRLAERSLAFVPPLTHLGPLHVTLLSVVDENEDFRLLTQPEAAEREVNVLQTYLHEIAGDMRKHLGIDVETDVRTGNPAELVLARSFAGDIELLLISTHGRSGMSRWRRGSVADKLIRGAGCSTLIVGPGAADTEGWLAAQAVAPFRKILVPLDASERAEQALVTAQTYAKHFDSELHLVEVINLTAYGDGLMIESSYTPGLEATLREAATEYLAKIQARTSTPGDVQTAVLIGSAAAALEEYAESHAIDLVVMTSHGRGGLARAALGSVTDRLIGGAAPVLVVRAS